MIGVFGDMRKFFDELRTNIPDFTNDQLESALMDKFNQERITPSEGEESGNQVTSTSIYYFFSIFPNNYKCRFFNGMSQSSSRTS